MIQNFKMGRVRLVESYQRAFDYKDGKGGFGFDCDKDGNLKEPMPEAARKNYHWCMEHPERFGRFNEVVRYQTTIRDANTGTCKCGKEIELHDQYMGACKCPVCGQWYNLFGQELLPPGQWEE